MLGPGGFFKSISDHLIDFIHVASLWHKRHIAFEVSKVHVIPSVKRERVSISYLAHLESVSIACRALSSQIAPARGLAREQAGQGPGGVLSAYDAGSGSCRINILFFVSTMLGSVALGFLL